MSAKKAAKKTTAKKNAKSTSPNKTAKTKNSQPKKVPTKKPDIPKKQKIDAIKTEAVLRQVDAAIGNEFDKTSVRVRVLFKEIVLPVFISLAKKYGPSVLDEVLVAAIRSTKNQFAKTTLQIVRNAIRTVSQA